MKATQAVFFDLDGTLVLARPEIWQLLAQFAREIGLAFGADGVRRAERFAHFYFAGTNSQADFERYGADGFRSNYIKRCLQAMQAEGELDEAVRYIVRRLGETPRTRYLPDGTLETLARLAGRGYTLGLVTNRRSDEMPGAYEGHQLEQYFAFTVTSSEAGMPKPGRAMFDLALARSGCASDEAIHVGDNFFADVAGARTAGIQPILVDPKGLFPEADCPVIQCLPQLLDHLS